MITPSFSPTATERVLPKLALDFTTASLDSRVTLTRALDTATCVNSSGNVAIVNANLPRFDYNPTTLVCNGLLIEEARTNIIRNNTMAGSAAGSPGTLPTNWSVLGADGLTRTIVGTGTENGINYIDIKFTGTATATFTGIVFDTGLSGITSNTAYTQSVYLKKIAGGFSSISAALFFRYNLTPSGSTDISTNITSFISSTAPLITNRPTSTGTTSASASGSGITFLIFNYVAGTVIDFTLRVGLPQIEAGAFATSVIQTSSGAVTRNADVATMTGTNFSNWYNATEGAFMVQGYDVSDAAHYSSQPRIFSAGTNASGNFIDVSRIPSSGQSRSQVQVSGVNQFNSLTAAWPVNTPTKIVTSYKLDSFAACLGGGTIRTDVSGTVPTVSALYIGSDNSYFWTGCIQRLFYWPQRLTNNEVQAFSK